MPIPLVTVLQSGKGFAGKQKLIKEFILMPKPHVSAQEVFRYSKLNLFLFLYLLELLFFK